MPRRAQLAVLLISVLLISSLLSHFLIYWLRIETSFGDPFVVGPKEATTTAFLAGSSLAADGISWERVGNSINTRIQGYGVAGSSPAEWELFQPISNSAELSFLVVSCYDLNEYFFCDFRAEIVPFWRTVRDLIKTEADFAFARDVVRLYPLAYVRAVFPTAGRAEGVMVGLRAKIAGAFAHNSKAVPTGSPTLAFDDEEGTNGIKTESISEWSPGRKMRRLESMRSACQGRHSFRGPKQLAFLRMLSFAVELGPVVVVVLPVSPMYTRRVFDSDASLAFERALLHAKGFAPEAKWIRLDKCQALASDQYYWDLVHMNTYGQLIATRALLERIG